MILPILLAVTLGIIFLSSIVINVSILMAFARKQTLRTTSNRYNLLYYLDKGTFFQDFLIPPFIS